MSQVIPVEADVAQLLFESAKNLGLVVEVKEIAVPLSNGEFFSVTAVRSSTNQLVTYPVTFNKFHRDRLITLPTSEALTKGKTFQEIVNEQVKTLNLYGANTFIFEKTGELKTIHEGIGKIALWSELFSVTSIFENAVRAAFQLPLGTSELIERDWILGCFSAPQHLDMQSPYLHLFAHQPKYRIRKLSTHSGFVALSNSANLEMELIHAIDYLEGVISE